MKPTKHILLLAALLLGSITASAEDFEVDGIYYNITSSSDLTVAVTFRGDYYYSYSNEYSGAVTIPSTVTYNRKTYSVTSIEDYTFYRCSSLTAITIPEGVTSIGNMSFYGCSKVNSVTIPASVTSIGQFAFDGFAGELTILCNIPSVSDVRRAPFYNCESTKIIIGSSVATIGENAFYGCGNLTSISIPASVKEIGSYAFDNCIALNEMIFEDGQDVLALGWNGTNYNGNRAAGLFSDCPLEIVYLGRNLSYSLDAGNGESYAYAPFHNKTELSALSIGEDVTTLSDCAFYGCTGIANITCHAVNPPTCGTDVFYQVDKSIPVYVPAGSVEAYKAAAYWSKFTNILPLPNEYALKVSAAGYATLYLDYSAEIPEGVEVYIASSVEDDRLLMTKMEGVLPAETGVIVSAKAGTYTFVESNGNPANVEGNLLSGTATDTYITAETGYKYYVLAQKDGLVAMYRPMLTDGQFLNNANKVYLKLKSNGLGIFDDETNTEDEDGQLSNRLRFDFGGTTSIQNSQFTIQNSQFIYDLHGRRVENPTKGIYIVNGRKVVVK